jgi:transcriptional regulator with XRE-family HTH domain
MNHEITFTGAGSVLRQYRTTRQLKMKDTAERMGINTSTLSRYESDDLPLSDRMISKAAKAFRVKATELMFDCLAHIQPKFKKSAFGQLLGEVIANENQGKPIAEVSASVKRQRVS